MQVRESQIEDILVSAPALTQSILDLQEQPRLLVRQMMVPSGRLDLLYVHRKELLLVELKVAPFRRTFLNQVLAYKRDLVAYQTRGALVAGEVRPYLLCTSATDEQRETAKAKDVTCVSYDPELLLRHFYHTLQPVASLAEIKPMDIGIWNLHLIHKFIYLLEETNQISQLQERVGGSPKTLYNKIRFASELRLVEWAPGGSLVTLSELGREYIRRKDDAFPSRLSDEQAGLLRDFVMRNPFESPVILGIAAIVEAVFILAKNSYPVPMSQLIEYFSYYAGKYFDWQTPKAKYSATRMYSNYAVDLGLLAKTGDLVYLTPDGVRFTLRLQLHKSLKMLEPAKLL